MAQYPQVIAKIDQYNFVIQWNKTMASVANTYAGVVDPPVKLGNLAAMGHSAHWQQHYQPGQIDVQPFLRLRPEGWQGWSGGAEEAQPNYGS